MAKSNWYGSPVKIFEYGAMGTCVIAPDNIPVRDVMDPETDGYLVDQTSAGLKRALDRAFSDAEETRRRALHFQSKVLSRHTWQHVADEILKHTT